MRATTFAFFAALVGISASAACDEPYPSDPAIDPEAPVVRIESPARGAYLGDVTSVTVTGKVIDASPLRELLVNGVAIAAGPEGDFTATVPLPATGTELITVEAVDRDGNVGRQTRAVAAGPRAPLSTRVRDSVTAAISDTAFEAVGNLVAQTLADKDLGAWIAPHNPVISKGAPDGPDCLFGNVAIGALDISAASISLLPTVTGLTLTAELTGVRVPMHLDYAALCIDGSSEALMTATKVRISGRFTFGIRGGQFDIKLLAPQVRFEGFALTLDGLPGQVVTLLDLGNTLGPVLSWAVEQLAAPILGDALAGFDGTTTTELLGKTLDVVVAPTEISFSPVDAKVRLDSAFRVHGDEGGPGFVMVPNSRPSMDATGGMQLAVSDDAVNQLLASFWAARGMDLAIDLTTGDYGGLGKLYDRVETQGLLPLSVRADGAGLAIVIPDLLVSFKEGDLLATQIAINGSLSIGVERGGDGALRLVSSAPKVFVDILREGVDGANPLASSQFEALTSFALGRLTQVATGLVGSVPLPTAAGATITGVSVSGRGGYLIIDAQAQ